MTRDTSGRRARSGLAAGVAITPSVVPAGAAVVVCVLALAGCGLGAGPAPKSVALTVTRNFGAQLVRNWSAPSVVGEETVMSLLTRNANVATREDGRFVQGIDGFSASTNSRGAPVAWFYYVNGVAAPKGAAETTVGPGVRIWWDQHDYSQTENVPAVVGSFPEPFVNGIEGKRLPVRVECAAASNGPCHMVASRLQRLGVLAAISAIGPAGGPETLRVLVGPWRGVRNGPGTLAIEDGPRASGVYARLSKGGTTLTLLDEQGHTARVLGAGAGLIAATSYGKEAPQWLVTGTDEAGVEAAARAFDGATLENRFAVVLAPGGGVLPAPAPTPTRTRTRG
jgi:Domain of unknown function (DUF4430)